MVLLLFHRPLVPFLHPSSLLPLPQDDELGIGNDDVELASVLHATMSGALGESKAKGAGALRAATANDGGGVDLPQPKKWSMDVLLNVIREDYVVKNVFSWKDVARSFDHVGFEIVSKQQFEFLVNALRDGIGNKGALLPMSWFWGRWSNATGQLSVFKHALSAKKMLSWSSTNSTTNSTTSRTSPVLPWNSPELIASLLDIAVGTEQYQIVRQMFEIPLRQCPDSLLINLSRVQPIWTRLKSNLIDILLPQFLTMSHPQSIPVLKTINEIDPGVLEKGAVSMYKVRVGGEKVVAWIVHARF